MEDTDKGNEWWWIDYLENEMDPSLDKDLELLLEHSQEDRDAFENFRLLKEWLRNCDPIGDWPVDARLERMRKNVMNAIHAGEDKDGYWPVTSRETKSLSV
jgi:hypothetical protein